MPFSTRNAYYLRASNYRVLPLFLYLDERHTDWMTDRVLQLVIAELQPKMKELLQASMVRGGPAGKKHKVYVERGKGYQYCYFLRGTTRTEVVLLKQKTFSLRPPTPPPRQSRRPARDAGSDEDEAEGAEVEEEEVNIKDYKPDVSLSYKGFGTSSLQLVLIIEPYPPLLSSEYAPPSSRLSTRSASVASSFSRSRTGGSRLGASRAGGSRYSSIAPSVEPPQAVPGVANMRNASRSISTTPLPNSRRGGGSVVPGGSVTPFRDSSSTPFPGESSTSTGGLRGGTPLFYPRDTPFDMDEEDEEAHQAYTEALREGRMRLPSVSRPAEPLGPDGKRKMSSSEKRSLRRRIEEEDDENIDDEPEGMRVLSQRLVESSRLEEGVVRVNGGWEEREVGEESAVLGKEEPGD